MIVSRIVMLMLSTSLIFSPTMLHAQAITHAGALSRFPQPSEQRIGRYVELIVDDTGNGLAAGVFDFPVDPDGHTMVYFPEEIERATGLRSPHFRVDIDERRAAVCATKRPLAPDQRRIVTLASASISVGLVVKPADTPSDAINMAIVRKRSEAEARQAELADLVAGFHAQHNQDVAQQADEKLLGLFLESATMVRPTAIMGDVEPYRKGSATLTIRDFEGAWMGPDDLLVSFLIENNGETAFDWAVVRAMGQDRTENYAKAARVRTPALPLEGAIGRIAPGKSARGAIWVRNAKNISGPLTLMLSEKDGMRPVMASLDNWIPLQTKHTMRMWEFRPVEPPDPEKGRVSVQLQGSYGALWLGDGTEMEDSDATSLRGLGARITYGFNRIFALEAEIMGAGTGRARFEQVRYDGITGTLERSAVLGRVQGGLLVRIGDSWYRPLARIGVGLQGSSHSGTLTGVTGAVSEFDSFEWNTLFTFGTGMDLRLDALLAGLALSVVTPMGELGERVFRGSIQAGLYVGYSWNP